MNDCFQADVCEVRAVRCGVFNNSEAPKQKTKRNSRADKATSAMVRSIHKLGCVSQDIESPPEPGVGHTNVRRSNKKKSGKKSQRTHLSLRCTRTAESFINITAAPTRLLLQTEIQIIRRGCKKNNLGMGQPVNHNPRNIPGEQRYILLTKNGIGNSIYLERQPRQKENLWWTSVHMMSKMELTPEELETINVSPTTVNTTNGSIDTTEEATVHESFGHVHHCTAPRKHSISLIHVKSLRRRWVFF